MDTGEDITNELPAPKRQRTETHLCEAEKVELISMDFRSILKDSNFRNEYSLLNGNTTEFASTSSDVQQILLLPQTISIEDASILEMQKEYLLKDLPDYLNEYERLHKKYNNILKHLSNTIEKKENDSNNKEIDFAVDLDSNLDLSDKDETSLDENILYFYLIKSLERIERHESFLENKRNAINAR